MSIRRFFVFATAILALGTTATATAQTTQIAPFNGDCSPLLPERNPGLPTEIKALVEKAALVCAETLSVRRAAHEDFLKVGEALSAAIADKKGDPTELLRLRIKYQNAYLELWQANRPMHEATLKVASAYFDMMIARNNSATPVGDGAISAYGTWEAAALGLEKHPGPDKDLLAAVEAAQKVRDAAEAAQFKKLSQEMDELLKVDRPSTKK